MLLYFHSHHKCASRWALQYIRDVAELNYLTLHHSDSTKDVAPTNADLAFFGNSSYDKAAAQNLDGVHFVRNPLNLIISSYFSHLNTHPERGWSELTKQRRLLRSVGFVEGLYMTLTFLERSDIGPPGTIGPLYALRNWDYDDARFRTVRIEDFVRQPAATIRPMLPMSRPTLPQDWRFAFAAFSGGRQPGQIDERSHYRSGDPDEWKALIPREIVQYVQINFAPLSVLYPEIVSHGLETAKEPVVLSA